MTLCIPEASEPNSSNKWGVSKEVQYFQIFLTINFFRERGGGGGGGGGEDKWSDVLINFDADAPMPIFFFQSSRMIFFTEKEKQTKWNDNTKLLLNAQRVINLYHTIQNSRRVNTFFLFCLKRWYSLLLSQQRN